MDDALRSIERVLWVQVFPLLALSASPVPLAADELLFLKLIDEPDTFARSIRQRDIAITPEI